MMERIQWEGLFSVRRTY